MKIILIKMIGLFSLTLIVLVVSDKGIVLVDNREPSVWFPSLLSAIEHTSSEWSVQVIVPKDYKYFEETERVFSEKIVDRNSSITITADSIYNEKNKHISVSNIMMKKCFWDQIPTENILFIQADSCVCRDGIEEYLNHSYIGSPWVHKPLGLSVGNGGTSFRKKSFLLECIRLKESGDKILSKIKSEDVFYGKCAEMLGVSSSLEDALSFGIESIFSENPFAVHKPLSGLFFTHLCKVCPDFKKIPFFYNSPHFKKSEACF